MKKALILAIALALAACKGDQKKSTGGTAQGEVLPGSVSDAMLPLDTVKSQAPLAPKSEGGAKPDGKDAKATSVAKDAAAQNEQPDAAEAPAASEDKPAADE